MQYHPSPRPPLFNGHQFTLSFMALVVTSAVTQISPARAQWPPPSQPLFESIRIGPRFNPDPLVLQGISGGRYPAPQIAERDETIIGPCSGFLDREPDHILQLTDYFHYLRLQVESPEDTTLVIRGPGGTWCNDDYSEKNPGIAGQWLTGTYGIWVGSYEADKYHPYILRVTEVR